MERRTGTTLAGLAAAIVVGWGAVSTPSEVLAQPASQQQQGQPAVPDAPKPQTLPKLNTVVPTAPALPDAPPATATTKPAVPETPVPSAPTPTASATAAAQNPNGEGVEVPVQGQGSYRIPIFVNFVEVPFLVKDSRGQMVPGITQRDIQILENNVPQAVRCFTSDPFPLSVALVIDQSVTFDTMNRINNALGALQGAFAPYDEIAVFTYNNGVKMQDAIGFNGATSARLGAVLEQSKGKGREPQMNIGGPLSQTTLINNQYQDPNTSPNHRTGSITEYPEREFHTLNDAVLEAAEQVAKAGTKAGPNQAHRRKIVYVISDGKEYGSKAKEKDVIKYCQTNNIAVYATLVGDSSLPVVGFLDRIHLPLTMRDNALPRYTTTTGGQLDAEFRQTGIEKSFAKIAEESRAQYFAGYYSRLPPLSEKFRTLDVRVRRPNLTVVAKEGYYPNASLNRPTAPPAQTAKPPVSSSPATSH